MTDLFATTPRTALPPGLIAPPFPEYSATSRQAHLVPYADRHAEIARELAVRREAWPRLVDAGRMAAADMERGIAVMAAIERDTAAEAHHRWGDGPHQPTLGISWRDKLDCLRWEIERRRDLYPRLIETARLPADDARRQLEAIEAVHHDYWSALWLWDGPAGEPGRSLIRAHIAALDTLQQKEAA